MNCMDFAKRLKYLREDAGYTPTTLAKLAQVSRAHIHSLENGLTAPTLDTLNKLAAALRITTAQLLNDKAVRIERIKLKRFSVRCRHDDGSDFEVLTLAYNPLQALRDVEAYLADNNCGPCLLTWEYVDAAE